MNLIHYAFVTVDKRASIGCISNVTSSHPDPHSYLTKQNRLKFASMKDWLIKQSLSTHRVISLLFSSMKP